MTDGKRDPSEFGGESAGWPDDIMNPGPQPKPEKPDEPPAPDDPSKQGSG